jgi:hypothetical protein
MLGGQRADAKRGMVAIEIILWSNDGHDYDDIEA